MGQSLQQKAKAKELTASVKAKKEAVEETADLEVTEVSDWKKSDRHGVKLRLPSGKVCLAFNPGIHVFLERGMIPNSLMPIVQQAIKEGKGLDAKKSQALAEDSAVLQDVMSLVNGIFLTVVVQPKVYSIPEDEEERNTERLYIDEVDLDDRLFIMQWVVGGTRDLERFRDEQAAALGNLSAGETVGSEA